MTIRHETWHLEDSGMVSQVIVQIREGEKVWMSPAIVAEFGMDPAYAHEVVDSARERFALEFDYDRVKERLEKGGWTR